MSFGEPVLIWQKVDVVTEFEELALKKITKDYLVDCIYGHINTISGRYGISNAEISKRIGWDPAVYNQKYNRSNDLRISTFIKIYIAIAETIQERACEFGFEDVTPENIQIGDLITDAELMTGSLFNHISAAAEGKTVFLSERKYQAAYIRMKPFVMASSKHKKFSEREVLVYVSYLKEMAQ